MDLEKTYLQSQPCYCRNRYLMTRYHTLCSIVVYNTGVLKHFNSREHILPPGANFALSY